MNTVIFRTIKDAENFYDDAKSEGLTVTQPRKDNTLDGGYNFALNCDIGEMQSSIFNVLVQNWNGLSS